MIPKIIHYAWLGNNPMPKSVAKCVKSWKKYCPDYEIRRWDESNYNCDFHPYTREAHAHEKYAFVVDFLRLDILYRYGGIFLDTDVEVIKSFDPLLEYTGFAGFERGEYEKYSVNVGAGVGSIVGNPIIKAMLEDYNGRIFVRRDGKLDMTPCPTFQTAVLKRFGLICENRQQNLGDMMIFTTDYFCPKDYYTSKIRITSNTYSIHHYSATWMPTYRKMWHFLKQKALFFRIVDKFRKSMRE